MAMVELMVVSGLPTPKAALAPTSETSKSFVVPPTLASTRPLPADHWPVPPVCVVFIQKAMVKSLLMLRGICMLLLEPLNAAA